MTEYPLPHKASTPANMLDFVTAILQADERTHATLDWQRVVDHSNLDEISSTPSSFNKIYPNFGGNARSPINKLIPLLRQMGWVTTDDDKNFIVTDSARQWYSATQADPASATQLWQVALGQLWFMQLQTQDGDSFAAQVRATTPEAEDGSIVAAHQLAQSVEVAPVPESPIATEIAVLDENSDTLHSDPTKSLIPSSPLGIRPPRGNTPSAEGDDTKPSRGLKPFGVNRPSNASDEALPRTTSPSASVKSLADLDVYSETEAASSAAALPSAKRLQLSNHNVNVNDGSNTVPPRNHLGRLAQARQQQAAGESPLSAPTSDEDSAANRIGSLTLKRDTPSQSRRAGSPNIDESPLDALRRAPAKADDDSSSAIRRRASVDNRTYGPRAQRAQLQDHGGVEDSPASIILTLPDQTRVEITQEFLQWWQAEHQVTAEQALAAIRAVFIEQQSLPKNTDEG